MLSQLQYQQQKYATVMPLVEITSIKQSLYTPVEEIQLVAAYGAA